MMKLLPICPVCGLPYQREPVGGWPFLSESDASFEVSSRPQAPVWGDRQTGRGHGREHGHGRGAAWEEGGWVHGDPASAWRGLGGEPGGEGEDDELGEGEKPVWWAYIGR